MGNKCVACRGKQYIELPPRTATSLAFVSEQLLVRCSNEQRPAPSARRPAGQIAAQLRRRDHKVSAALFRGNLTRPTPLADFDPLCTIAIA